MSHPPITVLEALESPSPMVRLLAALAWSRSERLPLLIGSPNHGVLYTGSLTEERWARDPRQLAVDPVGALILLKQPGFTEVESAANLALGTTAAYYHGLLDGLDRSGPDESWTRRPSDRLLYMAGFEDGGMLRMQLVGPMGVRGWQASRVGSA